MTQALPPALRPVDDDTLSDYDESVPGPPLHEPLATRFADLRAARGADPSALDAVRDLVLVVSSSRGGSTLLSQLLRTTPGLITVPGEVNPYVVVAQLSRYRRRAVLAAEIAAELGSPAADFSQVAAEDVVLQTAWRMTAQWPSAGLTLDRVDRAVHDALNAPDVASDSAAFTAAVLRHLGGRSRGLDLRRYDGADAYLPAGPAPAGPVADLVVEMTPYRLVQPWRPATRAELARGAVVLATPRNSFRLGLLRGLFPNAHVRLVHLTRNPAAAVNGLIDGWLHHGFFNCQVPGPLAIRGYTDRFPEWAARWWKYDVPPDWTSLTSASLGQVTAAQWRAAHQAILDTTRHGGWDVHRVAYEDVVGPPDARRRAATELAQWLGLSDTGDFVARVAAGIAPVMATVAPEAARWRKRAGELRWLVEDAQTAQLAQTLGYQPDPSTWT